ncbi:MAG: methyltransferase protein [Paucimonas sp.]|nr:methyltransferase protein [Paucimonas sp.]
MQERLDLVKMVPQFILDAGCGDGADLSLLQAAKGGLPLGVDASPAMLDEVRRQHGVAQSAFDWVLPSWLKRNRDGLAAPGLLCADFACLPLAAGSIDLVWSNLALHWHPQPPRVFAEWRRVLKTDGLLMFSCFGPDTFKELRAAFAQVDAFPHALPFVDLHDLGDMLVEVGFSTPVMDMEVITVTYDTVGKMLEDVRAFGGNPLVNRRKSMIGKAAWARVRSAIESMRNADGRLTLTFEIIYGHAFRPVARRTAEGEAIIRFEPRRR